MSRKRNLHQSKHPFDSYPFEACLDGSWQAVELLKIENGTMAMHFMDKRCVTLEKGPFYDLRTRSRKATLRDCSCILRPGIDVCVLSTSANENNVNQVWADARISSIQRRPHDSECSCQFYVNFYVNQGSLGTEIKTLTKEIKVIGINKICILQRLQRNPCEDQHYRWDSSEDSSVLSETKLLLGKFLADISWLIVASAVKRVIFCVRSLENKIVYQILGGDNDGSSLKSLNALNFKVDKDILVPFVSQVASSDTNSERHVHDSDEGDLSSYYNSEGLRRSKRRNVQPERYLGCDVAPELDVGFVRTRPYKMTDPGRDEDYDDEMSIPLSCLFGLQVRCPGEQVGRSEKVNKMNRPEELRVYRRKGKSRKVKLGDASQIQYEYQTKLAIVPVPDENYPAPLEYYHLDAKVTSNYAGHESGEVSSRHYYLTDTPKQRKEKINLLTFEPHHSPDKTPDLEYHRNEIDLTYTRCYSYGTSKVQRKKVHGLEDMDLENTWEKMHFGKVVPGKKYRSTCSRSKGDEGKYYRDRTLSAGAFKELIDSYLKHMNKTQTKEEAPITDQWKQIKAKNIFEQNSETVIPQKEVEEEMSEMDMLWREMEVSLASTYLEDTEEASNSGFFAEAAKEPSKLCRHDYRVDDEIGIHCRICGFVSTEIKYILPPLMQYSGWHQEEKKDVVEESEPKDDEDNAFHLLSTHASPDEPVSEESDNVWALIPDLRKKLHVHQKKAFEFLWKNMAGSMEPAHMAATSKRTGGCVISHAPGAGKTFLIIAFLVSYLKLFPGKRPLVLAPKTTLYTWYKEFIKWEIPLPVYLIHGRRTYRVFNQKEMYFPGVPKPTEDVKHVLDCLEKIQKWHAHPSILVMGYTSFLTLMREDAKYSHRRYMAKVLRESPGLLVLDEGHNPRSTKSRLRKVLMKVETESRILLSGTLFQNNFCEYFNTLCLARPKFAYEVLKELDPKYKRKKRVAEKARHLIESRARKFFLDNIAKKIDSDKGKERKQGLKMLKKITNEFIDVYEGGGSDTLPGLQIYTLLMNTTDIQHNILCRLGKRMAACKGYPLELELMITLGSIHPWLIKSAVCADRFFSLEELNELDKYKFDLKMGTKVKFVLSLVYRVVRKEKVLIFCHNIAPVRLFLELFEKFFGWQKGREVLVITGELELFERGRVMDRFEEPVGTSKVLLASISACAEGISLTAASRVILLDSEWNPSKTKQAIARAFRPGQQKMVYVYQLLAANTLEEDKYRRTTWKEWVSSMIFSEDFVEDPSKWQAEKIEDDILREMVEEDRSKSFHMIMKNEKASTN
ncbi:hypothetical protein L6164_029773 [Bauhinia variegata]|uniref:Uncharacterized protein n=1 Tax=Bauhinia variegata TaxID=167791 RepID=A0ACB9LB41_BAUVA|nr:hypothetical protein L6164_029773 [Bauhinia variegata]